MAKLPHKSGFKRYELVILGNAKNEKTYLNGKILTTKGSICLEQYTKSAGVGKLVCNVFSDCPGQGFTYLDSYSK